MKKITYLLSLILPLSLFAAERSVADAAALAAEFMNEQTIMAPSRQAGVASPYMLAHTRAKINSDAPAFYVFNRGDKEGFVVVSGDDRTEDILMYAPDGQLDVENANPNLRFWLNRLQEEISAANEENAVDKSPARKQAQVTAISPLLRNKSGQEISWDQEAPYWNNCPKDLWKTSETCLTGCVATATAQVMYKWAYPQKGTGSHSYTWECCTDSKCSKTSSQKLSKDFSSVTFDWDNMLATYNSDKIGTAAQKKAVAELMYCCGVACDMQYGGTTIGGSGAWTDDMAYALITYFGYKIEKFVSFYTRSTYSSAKGTDVANVTSEWSINATKLQNYFNADLEAGRPIIMGGEDSDGGHEFVCDGRDANGKFHINWGWEGESNCYCKLTALKPTGTTYNFSSNLDAIIGLQPDLGTVAVTGVSVSPTTLELQKDGTFTIDVTVSPKSATNKKVSWSSDDASVATVNAEGVVTGVGIGQTTIKVTTEDGHFSATCAVTVTPTDLIVPNVASPLHTKLLMDNQLYIQRGDRLYTIQGQLVR